MTNNRLKNFSDEEIYVIKRAMLDSSFSSAYLELYSESHKETHKSLLQEFVNEDTIRIKKINMKK